MATKIEKPKIQDLACKLREIQAELKQNLLQLHQKIEIIDSNPELLNGIEDLKINAQLQVSGLEAEVKQLREELTTIRKLLGVNIK